MNIKRLPIILIMAGTLYACAFHWNKPQNPPSSPLPPAAAPAALPAASQPVAEVPKPVAEVPKPVAEVPKPVAETSAPPKPQTGSSDGVVILPLEQSPRSHPEAKAVTPAPRTVAADKTPREFTITVEKKSPSHPNYGRGHDLGFVVDGVPGEELVLTRGVTYLFHVRTNVQHDFYFTTSPLGRGAGTVTDGVRGQFTYNGDVTFTPTAATPDVMYYECRNHPYMGGKIHIANAGDKVTVGGEAAGPPEATQHRAVTADQVKRKLSFAEMMAGSSATAKRVAGSNNAQAKQLFAQARQRIDAAHAALKAGDNAAAMQAVDESLHMLSEVGRLVPGEAEQDDKAQYSQLLEQVQGFEKSYRKDVEKGMKPKSGKGLDRSKLDGLMKEAEGLAAKEDYEGAVKPLERANKMLTEALGALLESQTVVYDKNFATAKEEYEYELSRYDSYDVLIPLAIEQRKPPEQAVTMMHDLAGRAKTIHDEGVALAEKGDHKQAIMALQAATDKLRQALRLAGVE